uniref:Uncharacterized protein n=1 Tax=Siphoviridae sp. ctBeL15 TaxID=2825374 RepID=A0A8S5V097_9CAUD|nr:MAG TPA: hypothetical protein [Siphoviridae sp. ctBeL15]
MTRGAYLKLPKGTPPPQRRRGPSSLYKPFRKKGCTGQCAATHPVSRGQFAQECGHGAQAPSPHVSSPTRT